MRIDITIVSGRRPDLLRQTLSSFDKYVFGNFEIGQVFVNIDPFLGTHDDELVCENMLHSQFSRCEIIKPVNASFGAAVKRLWQLPESDYFLHLEDDWLVLHPIYPGDVFSRLKGKIVQVQLSAIDKPYLPHKFSYKASWRSLLGLKILKKTHFDRPLFSTSPSFFCSGFAKDCADLLDSEKDPEKQLYNGTTKLTEYTSNFLNWPLTGPNRSAIVSDLGRSWLAKRGVYKEVINGISVWQKK